ncbi:MULTISPECIES: GNAT family N-acetyltransferase [unclassified Fusibacter]|uniref:GNAT family N-acetyltransferase n=1 Tax=unclassified Fusibacter TaxID=2624464 RepID=UPI0010104980|nr:MULTISPECIES: GNAT family N-acetyltransferase [unclassified Fusibacter]MCK8061096.1 GNAT family N-acetyltransferase [Fusibacter sp. A2]NPE23368.1 GNAT family N-acetyltransferase [Fusibacter sp. A1]RXV59413.1 N-acetyltransferase [Fusibacter sp. A1]
MFIETERLVLRKFANDDFDDFCEFAMDDEMCKMMGRNLMSTKDDARWNFEWLKDKEERGYVLQYKDTGRVIGNLTVGGVPKELLGLEELKDKIGRSMSFSISKSYQHKGLMFEAVSAVIKHLFELEGMDYVQCGHFPFNIASEMLQKKMDFKYLTTLRFVDEGIEVVSVENILWNSMKKTSL